MREVESQTSFSTQAWLQVSCVSKDRLEMKKERADNVGTQMNSVHTGTMVRPTTCERQGYSASATRMMI